MAITLSTAGGLVYSYMYSDFSSGFSIASYSVTCFSLILALIAAGEYFGMESPAAFSANDVYSLSGMTVEADDAFFDARVHPGRNIHRH